MSETQAEPVEAAEAPPVEADSNFSITRVPTGLAGEALDGMRISFGTPKRSITVRDLGLGDQFDLVEVAGDRTGNEIWMAMAGLAWATVEIDGVPHPKSKNLAQIRSTLDRVKPDGLAAYFKAVRLLQQSKGEIVATAKN